MIRLHSQTGSWWGRCTAWTTIFRDLTPRSWGVGTSDSQGALQWIYNQWTVSVYKGRWISLHGDFQRAPKPRVEHGSLPLRQTLLGQDRRGRGSHSGTMRSNQELGGEGGGKEVSACKHWRMLLLWRKKPECVFLWLKNFKHLVKCENFRLWRNFLLFVFLWEKCCHTASQISYASTTLLL